MQDHDQRFKNLIQIFFAKFLLLFFSQWAQRLDCSQVEWLDKEVFGDPPTGDRSVLDLVAKLPACEPIPGHESNELGVWLALVHIEIESPDKAAPLRPRMFDYYTALRKRYDLPVLPIALFLKVGLNGIGVDSYEEHFWELRPIRFEYLYVGLPALDAVEYVHGENWLGWALAALMKIPKERVVELGAEALRHIAETPMSDQKRFILRECIQAYLPIDEEQKRALVGILETEKYSGVKAMNKTVYEEGIEKGIEKGIETGEIRGRRAVLREQLEARFGAVSPSINERLNQMSLQELIDLGKTLIRAQSLAELGLEK